jgi:hypothetical protein
VLSLFSSFYGVLNILVEKSIISDLDSMGKCVLLFGFLFCICFHQWYCYLIESDFIVIPAFELILADHLF